jgi:surface protein
MSAAALETKTKAITSGSEEQNALSQENGDNDFLMSSVTTNETTVLEQTLAPTQQPKQVDDDEYKTEDSLVENETRTRTPKRGGRDENQTDSSKVDGQRNEAGETEITRPGAFPIAGLGARCYSSSSSSDDEVFPASIETGRMASISTLTPTAFIVDERPIDAILEQLQVQGDEIRRLRQAAESTATAIAVEATTLSPSVQSSSREEEENNKSPDDAADESVKGKQRRRRCYITILVSILIAVVAVVAITIGVTRNSAITALPAGFSCFTTQAELEAAVTQYLHEFGSPRSDVSEIYGWPIGSWCVGSITDFSHLFSAERTNLASTTFNDDISGWDVSSATDLSYMFSGAMQFNQDLSSWNVASVTSMRGLFQGTIFNQDLSSWGKCIIGVNCLALYLSPPSLFLMIDSSNIYVVYTDTSSVIDMSEMFLNATKFNQDLVTWNVSQVVNMQSMFYVATSFNGNVSTWVCLSLYIYIVNPVSLLAHPLLHGLTSCTTRMLARLKI